jgi:STE24 endopeptidase
MWLLWVVAFAIVLRLAAQLILARLNMAEVRRPAGTMPARFDGVMDADAFRRSAEYTIAKSRFGMAADVWEAAVLAAIVFSGVLPAAWEAWLRLTGTDAAWSGALFLVSAAVALALPDLPLAWWAQFRIEERFGFNRSTRRLWVIDRLKGLVLSLAIGLPLAWVLLNLVEWTGPLWWIYAWAVFMTFQVVMIVLYPVLILPWFNTLTPLPEGEFAEFVEEGRRWKGAPARMNDAPPRRLASWGDLEICQVERAILVRVRAPLFDAWWHDPTVWEGDPFDAMFRWLAERDAT